MGRPERPVDPAAGPVQQLAYDLRQLRRAVGGPSYRQLAQRARYSVTALSEAAGGEVLPTLEVTLAYVAACGGDRDQWQARWQAAVRQLTGDAQDGDGLAGQMAGQWAPYLGLAAFQPEDADRFF